MGHVSVVVSGCVGRNRTALYCIILGGCMMSPLAAAWLLLDHLVAPIMISMLGHLEGLSICKEVYSFFITIEMWSCDTGASW